MANFQYTTDIKSDVLFRAGEQTDGTSDYDALVLRYINRAQMAIALGGCEFAPEINEDWWWLRKDPPGVLTLQAPYEDGDVVVVNNSTTITFSVPPTFSASGWMFRSTNGDVFRVISHVAGDPSATLDSVYTGLSGTYAYTLFKVEYTLASDCLRIVGAMRGYADGQFRIDGCESQSLDRDWPLGLIEQGRPSRFAPVTETKVRFNRCGVTTNGGLIRVEYDYLYRPADLTASVGEEPVVPKHFRYLLADMALFWLYLTKDDNRDQKLSQIAARGIEGMKRENDRKKVVYGTNFGRINARGGANADNAPLRTESGMIIG